MEPESPNTHAPEFQTGCELACSTDTPDGARTHRLCDLEGLFFSPICSPSSHRAETPVLSQTAAVCRRDTGLDRHIDKLDRHTSLSDFPRFNLPQIKSTRRVRAWASGSMEFACRDGCLVRGTTMLDRIQSPSHDKAGAGQSSSSLPCLIRNAT